MAASAGTHSYGSDLAYSDTLGGGGSFTSVAEVCDISADGPTVGSTKFTHLKSDNAAHEYKPGLIEGGELTFTVNHIKAVRNTLMGFLRVMKSWKVTDPDGGFTTCDGFITSLGKKNPEDDRVTGDIKIKFTGKPVYTAP